MNASTLPAPTAKGKATQPAAKKAAKKATASKPAAPEPDRNPNTPDMVEQGGAA